VIRASCALLLAAAVLAPVPAAGELVLPPGFTAHVYVTGDGFGSGSWQGVPGIPAVSTLAVDDAGVLYVARTGRRYLAPAETDDLWPLYRIPAGGAQLTPQSEARYFFGPPLRNAQVGTIRAGREVLLTTFDRERGIGVLYRMVNGRVGLLAGGTPDPGSPPLLRQPEGVAVDRAGNLYVADRVQGTVVRLDPRGHVLDSRYLNVLRPRLLAAGGETLWVAGDGNAEAPWQRGAGEIWAFGAGGTRSLVARGFTAAAMALPPGGRLFVADRHAAEVFVLAPDGRRAEFIRFTDSDAPRGLAIAPVTPETRQAGIAGDLFVVTIRRGAWPINEIVRVSGPFDQLLRGR
jgi:hypothetical protein